MIWYQEIIGYIGMFFIFLSFFFKSAKKIRIWNSVGGIFCLVYGLITSTYATAVLNFCCIIVNTFIILKKNK